jgi:hypothetical protein
MDLPSQSRWEEREFCEWPPAAAAYSIVLYGVRRPVSTDILEFFAAPDFLVAVWKCW